MADEVEMQARERAVSGVGESLTSDEEFYEQNGYCWDYVIVFKVFTETDKVTAYQKENSMSKILHKLAAGGLETKCYYSAQRDEVYCKIRAPLERLMLQADAIDMKLKMDPEKLRMLAESGVKENNKFIIKPIILPDAAKDPYEDIHGKFDNIDRLRPVWMRYGPKQIMFRSCDRLKLIMSIMEERNDGGCKMEVKNYVYKKAVLACYPLHEDSLRFPLKEKWMALKEMPYNQPFDDIKDYFGEKVALYFAWLGHYTTWLIGPSLIGLAASINIWVVGNNPDVKSIAGFGAFMCFWSTFFLEFWKRRNASLRQKWGMEGFEALEETRPEFVGDLMKSPVTGVEELVADAAKQIKNMIISALVVGTFVCVVIGVVSMVVIIYLFRFYASGGKKSWTESFTDGPVFEKNATAVGLEWTSDGTMYATQIAGLLNAVQIQVLNTIYQVVAIKLTDWENHRTDTMYEDNLIAKVFIFQFINSFGSMFYIAFVKDQIGDVCKDGDCLSELRSALSIIFLTRLVVGNIQEIAIPAVAAKVKQFMGNRGSDKTVKMSVAEEEFYLAEYDKRGLFDDYAEMIIQFGYASLFVVAFPLAPLLALMNNYIEIRVDAFKLLVQTRRPEPRGAEDIGTWQTILEIMGTASVITNTLLVIYAVNSVSGHLNSLQKLLAFVLIEHAILGIKFGFAALVPDVPEAVDLQSQRADFLQRKLILLERDDDAIDLKGVTVRPNITVHDNDDSRKLSQITKESSIIATSGAKRGSTQAI